jgi:hypothetical protein
MPKQTAVELLKRDLDSEIKSGTKMVVNWDMYLAMEKEQIVNAVDGFPLDKRHLDGEQYYNETYGGNNE